MDIVTYEVQGRVPVTVLQPQGDLDGRTFQELIGKGREAYSAGARAIVIDLVGVRYLSSAGLMAIQSIARLLQGHKMLDSEAGWSTLRTMWNEPPAQEGLQPQVKLVNPQPAVDNVLDMAGFKQVFQVFPDVKAALESF